MQTETGSWIQKQIKKSTCLNSLTISFWYCTGFEYYNISQENKDQKNNGISNLWFDTYTGYKNGKKEKKYGVIKCNIF